MRDIRELGLKWPGPKLRQEDVKDLETSFSLTLPRDYLEFLSQVNGGQPKASLYSSKEEQQEEHLNVVGYLFPLTGDREEMGEIWWETRRLRDVLSEVGRGTDVLAVARDGSINPIYLDLSAMPPSVHILYLDNELLDYKIADTFEQFLDGLSL